MLVFSLKTLPSDFIGSDIPLTNCMGKRNIFWTCTLYKYFTILKYSQRFIYLLQVNVVSQNALFNIVVYDRCPTSCKTQKMQRIIYCGYIKKEMVPYI